MKKTLFIIVLFIAIIYGNNSFAGIEYTDIADTTIVMPDSAGQTNYLLIDLNNDSITDFKIFASYTMSWEGYHPPHDSYEISILGLDSNMVNSGPFFANDTIRDNLNFEHYSWISGGIPGQGPLGKWPYFNSNPDSYAFVGLKFILNNKTYYGWIKLKTNGKSFTVESFAYNGVEDDVILAGQTY